MTCCRLRLRRQKKKIIPAKVIKVKTFQNAVQPHSEPELLKHGYSRLVHVTLGASHWPLALHRIVGVYLWIKPCLQ